MKRRVRSVGLAEVPDVLNWVKKDTLYLSTLYSFQNPKDLQGLVVDFLKKKRPDLLLNRKDL